MYQVLSNRACTGHRRPSSTKYTIQAIGPITPADLAGSRVRNLAPYRIGTRGLCKTAEAPITYLNSEVYAPITITTHSQECAVVVIIVKRLFFQFKENTRLVHLANTDIVHKNSVNSLIGGHDRVEVGETRKLG